MSNLLKALSQAIHLPSIRSRSKTINRMNAQGDLLESMVQKLFTTNSDPFSYIGNASNPPDLMLKGGDAIEVKKLTSPRADLNLNSSYPKRVLSSKSLSITNHCRTCEDWKQKDLLYVIGCMKGNKIRYLWFIYGDCFIPKAKYYQTLVNSIRESIEDKSSPTRELGKVKDVDPLALSQLRIRAMWSIKNPVVIFDKLVPYPQYKPYQVVSLMTLTKYRQFPEQDRQNIESFMHVKGCTIKNPNDPTKRKKAILITN